MPYKGADQHRVESSKHVRFMRCAILGDVARSTAALDVAPKSGVYTLVNQGGGTTFGNANESDDIEWRQCVFMGSSKAVFGHRAGRSDDIRIDGCVSAQNFGDFIQFVGEGQTDNWTIKDTYAMAKGRASAADHRDFIQFEKVLTPHSHANWSIEGNWIQSRDAWGDDRYLAKQGLWGNANLGAMKDTAVDNLFAIPGKAMQGHWKDVTFEFNTIIPPIDSLGADSNDQNGVRPNTWDPAFIVPANDDATLAADENIIVSHANGFDNGFAGPNGLVIWQNGFWQFSHANKGPPDWSLLGKYLENYAGAPTKPVSVDYTNSGTAANNGKYQLSPRESSDAVGVPDVGVEQFKPKAGTRMHWADPDPTGCYKLFERVFDTTNHDNPTDWGWPTAVAFHIYYDPNNAAGGASGNYDSFDANGD
ncbi:MAG: hypothetical protein H6717_35685 [Polyangiaceae bacterium]|nr:hypothetical protein [Polyangiaceae bacterium]